MIRAINHCGEEIKVPLYAKMGEDFFSKIWKQIPLIFDTDRDHTITKLSTQDPNNFLYISNVVYNVWK